MTPSVTPSVTRSVTSSGMTASTDLRQNSSVPVTDPNHVVPTSVPVDVPPPVPLSADDLAKRVVGLLEDRFAPRARCRWPGCVDHAGAPPEEQNLVELTPFCSAHRTIIRYSAPQRARFGISDTAAATCAVPGCPRPPARRGLCWTHYKKLPEMPEAPAVSGAVVLVKKG